MWLRAHGFQPNAFPLIQVYNATNPAAMPAETDYWRVNPPLLGITQMSQANDIRVRLDPDETETIGMPRTRDRAGP